MSTATLDIPVFDADNHLYETKDALHQVPARALQGRRRLRRRPGPHQDRRQGDRSATTSPTPPSTWSPRPGRRRTTSASATPRARAAARSSASRCGRSRRSASPAPRVELMDEQGIDRALMFPTLASLLEERMRDDPELIHAVIHALNEWMHETWSSTTRAASSPRRSSRCRSSRRPSRSSSGCVERGAKVVLDPARRRSPGSEVRGRSACPSSTRSGSRSSSTTSSSPCTPPTAATSATPTTGWAAAARCCRSSPRRSACCRRGGRSRTRCRRSSATAPCPASRSSRSRSSRTAAAGSSRCSNNMADIYKKMPQDFPEDPIEVIKRNIYISPFWEEDLGALAELIGDGPRAVRLRLPAPRGPGRPGELRRRAGGRSRGDRPQDHGRQPRPADERRGRGPSMTDAQRQLGQHPRHDRRRRRAVRRSAGHRRRRHQLHLRRAARARRATFGAALVGVGRRAGRPGGHLGAQQRASGSSPCSASSRPAPCSSRSTPGSRAPRPRTSSSAAGPACW